MSRAALDLTAKERRRFGLFDGVTRMSIDDMMEHSIITMVPICRNRTK